MHPVPYVIPRHPASQPSVAYKLPAKPACFMGVLGCTLPGLVARFEVEVQTIDPRTCSVEPLGEPCRSLERRRVSIFGSGVGEQLARVRGTHAQPTCAKQSVNMFCAAFAIR